MDGVRARVGLQLTIVFIICPCLKLLQNASQGLISPPNSSKDNIYNGLKGDNQQIVTFKKVKLENDGLSNHFLSIFSSKP